MMSEDPYRAFNFKLEIEGVTQGHFTECTGLGAKVEVIPYREAGNNQVGRKIPGFSTCSPVTVHYGLTNSKEMWEWFESAAKGKVIRKNISLVLLDADGATEVTRWNMTNAWVSEWRGAPLNASSQEIAIESMVIECETLQRD
jgi:phage tail-like protein